VIRISKIADYGVVLLARLADDEARPTCNARELAAEANLPTPIVSKVLKSLARGGLLESQRGVKGGYRLARPADQISVAEIIRALEGPIALTECTLAPQTCEHELACALRTPWQRINEIVLATLAEVTLADLIDPTHAAATSPRSRGSELLHIERGH
jgi:FeS assembly SUF system regulator